MYCERRIEACIERYPLIKLMIEAMEKHGCPIDYRRHFSCEYCGPLVGGGYDPELNQIVICYNKLRSVQRIESTLTHELVHMFDYCRAEFDCNSLEHVACSEIRAANLAHCSLIDSFYQLTTTPTRIAKTQQDCVKTRAANSIQASRPDLSRSDIMAVVDKVFDRCFNDLEPIGRRCRLSKKQRLLTYKERKYYDFE
ncbi:hypothetical protein B4U80_06612 [Leptotrombidium deliense]|uniref:Mitochondrial inner membrane protease ATP23 n=1 Tax=Leptotrombidium deliense TaxID=299467 RepID=A0A443SFK9_9ACAR|nr:hypothetical protein B4U80_06612 [Leptotrombidium deliense]